MCITVFSHLISKKCSHKYQFCLSSFIDLLTDNSSDPGVHFHSGLSDCKVIIGEAAALECKLSSEECNGKWYKDGEEVSTQLNKLENEYVAVVAGSTEIYLIPTRFV